MSGNQPSIAASAPTNGLENIFGSNGIASRFNGSSNGGGIGGMFMKMIESFMEMFSGKGGPLSTMGNGGGLIAQLGNMLGFGNTPATSVDPNSGATQTATVANTGFSVVPAQTTPSIQIPYAPPSPGA